LESLAKLVSDKPLLLIVCVAIGDTFTQCFYSSLESDKALFESLSNWACLIRFRYRKKITI